MAYKVSTSCLRHEFYEVGRVFIKFIFDVYHKCFGLGMYWNYANGKDLIKFLSLD